jgi:PEGA domain/PDZ domain
MKRLFIAVCVSLMFSTPALLAPAAMAQAPQPAISDAGSGSIPSEPGMYVQARGGFDKILGQIVAFTRSGSLLVSGLTAGIKTRKQNVQLLGPRAQTVINGKPVFYFIPPRQEADAGVNAGDLVLVRLEEKAERRQFEIGAQGLARASSGISITHQIQLFRSEAKPGVYTITPALELGNGEYALYLARGEGMQAYVYDFSVSSSCCALTRPGGEVETVSRVQPAPTTMPAGVTATRPKTGGLGDAGTNASNPARSTGEATAEISSDPLGADIEIDGNFVGSTPSSVGIVAGEHTLRVSKSGYRKWERTLKSSTGKITIAARLEPIPIDASATSHPPTEVAAVRDPDPPANSSEGVAAEARIGIWLTGNPTARHDGIEISGVQPEGPAASIGIQPGDLLLAIDGHYLYSIDDLRSDLLRRERGARLAIRYRHGRLTYDNYLVLASNNGPFR